MEDNWTPPSDAEVTDWTPPSDAQIVDEPVKKKVTPSPSQTPSSSNGLNLLSGVIPSGKALLTGQKEESAPTDQKPIDLTNAPIAEDESTRTDKFIRKPIDKKKVDEIYTLSKQNESLVDEFAKSHFVLDNLSQTEAIKQLNDLYAKREQAKDPQTAQAIDNQIEVIKSQPVEKQPSIQEAILQNAQKYGSQPQDFNRPEIPMNPLTPNQILERNGMKTANTVGELHDRYVESATKLNELRPELDKTATELDAFKKDARTADFKTDKSGNKTLEGLADIPEAFGHGFGGTMKSIEQGFVNLLGDKQDRIDYAKKRYLEDNILYPTRTKGMATSGSEMIGGVAPYVISTAVLPETALLGHVITNGLTMGASGYGNGYYEMFAKQKQQGVSDEEADAIAMQNAKFEGAKETAIGASLPFMGGAGSKLFLAPAEKSAMKQFLATQGVIIPTFTAGKLASNTFQKYGLGEKDVNLGDGLAETAENGLILGAMMEFAHKAPPKLKELYRANLSEQYPSIQQSVDKAVKDGVMDASQGYAFTEKLKRDFAVFNAMPKDITTEQKLAIEPEVKQIIELSSREPSAVESPEVTKDKIVQLQKQVAEKLGTPLTEKEQKAYEKLLERQKPIKSESGKEITLELFPSEKAELNHYEKRIKTAEDIEFKLAEEKKVAEAETPPTNVGVEAGSGGVGGDAPLKENEYYHATDNNEILAPSDKGYKKREGNNVVGEGIYFGKDKEHLTDRYGENIIKVELDIKNPLVSDNKYIVVDGREIDVQSLSKDDINFLKEKGYDAIKYVAADKAYSKFNETIVFDKSQIKKSEQSLKETTKAETPKVEAGSGGVGGDGKKITITGYRNKGSKDVGENGTFYTQSEQDRPTNKKEISFDNALVLTDEQVEQFEGLPNEYLAYEWFPDVDFTKEAKRQGISESGHLMDKMVTEEAIKRGYDGIVYGTNEIVDLRTHPKPTEQSLKETPQAGSVGVVDVGRKPIGDGKFVRYNPDDVLPLLPDYKPTNTVAVEDYVNQVVPNDASVEAYKTVPLDAIQTSEKIESKDRKAIDKIKEGIKNGDDIPPLVLDFSPVIKNGETYKFGLMDGHHRYIAYKELGIKEVPAAIVTSREHYTFETNDTNIKTLFEQPLKETTQSETPKVEAGSGGVGGDVKPTPQKVKVLGKDVNMYNDYIPSKVEDVEPDAMYSFNANSKDGIPSLLHDIAYANKREVNGVKSENWHASISGEELLKLYPKEQSLKETTQSETKVAEKGVEEPITEEIKTAIDNGEITREQADDYIKNNDGAKSESTIEAIERKAESEDETELNSAIDQADKLIGEAVGATEGEKQPTDKGTSEDKVTGIKKAMVEKDRENAGLPPIELPKSNKPQEQLERAKELVDSGEVDPSELEAYLISHAENPSDAKTSESDQYVLQYQRMKIEARSKEILTERMAIEDRLKEDPTDVQANLDLASNEIARQQNIYDLDRNTIASRVTSSIWGKLGNAKQQVINERGIVQEQINRIKELHGKDVPKEVQDKLDSLEKKNTELTARIEAIEKNITEQIAQGQLNKESRKPLIRRTSRRSDEEINAQIKDKLSTIANKIAERIEKSTVKNFAANKEQSKSLIADIAPDVMDVVKLVSEKTGNKLEDVVNKTYDTIKDIAEGIGKRDIVDIIAGKYSDKKPLSELQKQINEIRNQAKLTIRLEEIKNNIERETKSRGEASPEVKALRKEISELQSQEGLRKRIEDVKNGVEKKVKEKGEQSEEVKALRKELSDLESQDRLKKRIEDLQNGVLRETKARGEASPEVQKLKKQADELNKKNKKELANFSANELKKQVEQLQKKINKGEFLPQKTVKKAFEQDANWVKYSQEKKKLKQELNHLEAQALYDKKNLYMKTLDQFNKFSRLGLFIFSTAYQLKLAAAALSTIAHKPIEDLVGTAIKPMVKEIADRAPIEGRNINAEATAEFYKNLSPIKILRGAYQILSKGESDLSRELSSHPKKEGNIFNPLSDHSVLNWIADDPHKIIKNPIKQGIFDASLANYMNYYASKGMDINDPVLIEKARQASYMRAEYEIFMGGEHSKNAVAEWFKKMETEGILDAQSESFKTRQGGNAKYSISALKNFIVPIASVPANILNRTIRNNPVSTAYRFSEAMKTNSELKNNVTETLDNLTEAQADIMLRDLKKGAIGSVYWTLGFIMAGNALGGFFNKSYPDKKRDKDEKGHDGMEIFGINIPHGVQHAVPLQQMQMAATFALTLKYFNEQDKKKLKDDFGLKDEIKNAGAGGAEVAMTYINEHPMSKASLDIVKALEGGKGREKYFNSLERRSDIPQTKFLLQDIGLIEKDDSYEKQKAKSKKHKEVKDLYDVFWYMMDDKKFENHNE